MPLLRYTLLLLREGTANVRLHHNPQLALDRNTIKIATELLQSSQRSYGSCRNGVTTIAATGLRQTQ
ncbi:hypothetical protein [Prevotella nigrescens]